MVYTRTFERTLLAHTKSRRSVGKMETIKSGTGDLRVESPEEVVRGVVEKLEEEIMCSKCKRRYENPKFLQCCHVFCERCVVIEEVGQLTVNCPDPECRRPTPLPEDGVAGLQLATHIHCLFGILDTLKRVSSPTKSQWKNCKKNGASWYCRTCGHICDACKTVHSGWESHEIISLDQLTHDMTDSTSDLCFEKCRAEGPGLHIAVVGETATATVYVVDKKGREYKYPVKVSCELVSSNGLSQVYGECRRLKSTNIYELTYQPEQRGQHLLHVQVAGKCLPKSPYKVFVFATEPVHTILEGCSYLNRFAINDKGQIVLTNNHCISIVNPNGVQLRCFGSNGADPGRFSSPIGVALNASGDILVCDYSNHRVQQFSHAGQLVKCAGANGTSPLCFNYPVGIAVHPRSKKVYIAEQGNHRVQILNSDLTFASMFGCHGPENGQFIKPCDIAFDSCGNVFVLDHDNLRIQVFTSGGEYIRQFGRRGNLEGELDDPQTIAIDSSDRVFVSERNSHRISIFGPDGQFLRSFGKQGRKLGEFYTPCGVDIDRDGHMHVVDLNQNGTFRLQVF